jgi:hypothetical protein
MSGFFVLENIQNLKDKNATERNKSVNGKSSVGIQSAVFRTE